MNKQYTIPEIVEWLKGNRIIANDGVTDNPMNTMLNYSIETIEHEEDGIEAVLERLKSYPQSALHVPTK
jgi:hypothetical protein